MAARADKPKPKSDMEEAMPDDEAEDDEAEGAGKKKEKEHMTESEANAAIAAARDEGFAEAQARANAVIGSEHYAGREALATTMLANDKLSGDEIVTMLAAAPKASAPAPAAAEADDDKAREDMRKNLAAEQPGPTGQAADEPEAESEPVLVNNMKARFGLDKK